VLLGAFDAFEWVGPWNDQAMKFYEAAKYYYYPGMHEPGSMLSLGMNAAWWGKLSKSDQFVIDAAAAMENDVMMAEFNAKNGASLAQLITNNGVQLREFNDDVYDAFGRAADEVFAEVVAHSDLAKRIHESFLKARADIGGWTNISDQAYVAQRNRVLGL
jgi:TRAP-type mannitol/chloroaromatic compound transport system substrate-binding protein